MEKILLSLKSRTAWTIVAMFLIGGVGALDSVIPGSAKPLVEGILSMLAIYFKISPSQSYGVK